MGYLKLIISRRQAKGSEIPINIRGEEINSSWDPVEKQKSPMELGNRYLEHTPEYAGYLN